MTKTVSDWRETTIGEIVEFLDYRRVPLSGQERQKRQGSYPYYGASGIIDHIDDYIFDGKFLLVAEDGENLNSRKLSIAFFASGKFWVNNHAHIIQALKDEADDYFIKAWFDQANISGYITGTAQPKLSQENLRRIQIKLPSLPTQRKIAAILSAYDDLIENNQRRIKILEEMAQNLYTEWFVKFRFPWHEKVKMVDSPLGRIPEGWEITKLFDAAEVTYGFPFNSRLFTQEPIGKPVIRIRNILNGTSKTHTSENTNDKYIVKNGDILIGMDGEFHMCKWANGEAMLNQRVVRLRPKIDLSTYYLFLSMKEPIKHFENTIVGTTVAHLSDEDLRSIEILIPNEKVSNSANDLLNDIFNKEIKLKQVNLNLRCTRDFLLPKLISGELDVSDLDINTGESE